MGVGESEYFNFMTILKTEVELVSIHAPPIIQPVPHTYKFKDCDILATKSLGSMLTHLSFDMGCVDSNFKLIKLSNFFLITNNIICLLLFVCIHGGKK